LFNIQSDIQQNDYRYSMNGVIHTGAKVITGAKFNCKAAIQGTTSCYEFEYELE